MKISLILFIIGIIFIAIGLSYQHTKDKNIKKQIEFVPRSVYDELSLSTIIK